jgi:hypothetical protein
MGRDYSAATLHRLRVRHAIDAFEEIIALASEGADVEALARVAHGALRAISLDTTPAELDPRQLDIVRELRANPQ